MPLIEHHGVTPEVPDSCFIAPDADVIGDVVLGQWASIWYHCVVRGDGNSIRIGDYTNIQDLSMVHIGRQYPTVVGNYVTGGHRVTIHGCTIEDDVLIGMGATILNGAYVGRGSIIGAGAVVTEGTEVPACSLVLGVPGKVVRNLPPETAQRNRERALGYVMNQCSFRGVDPPSFEGLL